jgi:hypothetical protein
VLDLSADVLLAVAGLLERAAGRAAADTQGGPAAGQGDEGETGVGTEGRERRLDVEAAIDADPGLSPEQKAALIQVYRSYVRAAPGR